MVVMGGIQNQRWHNLQKREQDSVAPEACPHELFSAEVTLVRSRGVSSSSEQHSSPWTVKFVQLAERGWAAPVLCPLQLTLSHRCQLLS